VRDPALVEAAVMAGRQLIQFLGLGIEFTGKQGPFLKPYTKYNHLSVSATIAALK
jgi:hypothetical protein